MNENFKLICCKNLNSLNYEIMKKFQEVSSKELEKMLNELIKTEEVFIEMDEVFNFLLQKLDKSLNKILINKVAKDIDKQTNLF